MKFQRVTLSWLFFSASLTVASAFTPSAIAQCIMTDVSIQAAVRGSQRPAQQTNNVAMQSEGSCVGNTTTSTSAQIYTGSAEQVVQERKSTHHLSGSRGNRTAVEGTTITVPVEVKVDVYNPAYDRDNFGF